MNQQPPLPDKPTGSFQGQSNGVLGWLSNSVVAVFRLGAAQLSRLVSIPWTRTAMIVVAVFVIDCLTPLGIATGALYMAAVLSAVPLRHPRAVCLTALVCSLLVLAGWLISPGQGETEWWKVLTNRALDLGVIWAAAGMAEAWSRLQQRRLRQIQEARLLHQATMLSASQLSFREALENSLCMLCDILGWPVGHVYLRDRDGEYIVPSDIWQTPEQERFDLLRAAARDLRYAHGKGAPGRVLAEGGPVAVADVTESTDYEWLKEPELLGVRGAFLLPITVGRKTAAVMEFFSAHPIVADAEFIALTQSVGEQLGRLFERRRADESLRLTEERLRLALEGGGMGVFEWHLDSGRVVWSPELERIHGLGPGTFEGTMEAVQQEIHPEDRERVAEAVRKAVEQGQEHRIEYRMIRPDGAVRWLEGRGTIQADAEGIPQRMVGVCMDVTERKDAEERNARLAAIVQSSDDAILAKALDGTILSWNLGAERIYGFSADEMVGKPVSTLVPPGQPDDTRDIMARIARNERVDHYETLRRRKDGRRITISLTVSPILDAEGNVIGASSVGRDVTEKKQAEQEMTKAREEAETANRLRGRFLANMSHELRTPMNSILGMLQLALGEGVPSEVRRWLTTAKLSADSLLSLLNDLLDMSKIDAGKLEIQPEPFHLHKLLDETARSLAVKAFEKGVELLVDIESDVPDRVVGDAGRLRQVLSNLITNAIKFTEQGEVVVTVALVEERSGETIVRFSVADTGVGISPEDQARVFEPFIQSDVTTSRRQGGTGLGLSIAAEIVRRMGGEIKLESEPDKGSRLSFCIPLRGEIDSALDALHPQDTGRLEGVRVLVVEGNAASRALVVKRLNEWSMQADAAVDCDHAVGKLQRAETERRAYHLVIADTARPETDGSALADRMAGAVAEAPPLIFMHWPCGRGAGDMASSALARLEKPISTAQLRKAVAQALGCALPAGEDRPEPSFSLPASRDLSVLLAEDTAANQEVVTCALGRRGHTVTVVGNGRKAVDLIEERHFDVVLMDLTMPVMDGYEATAAIRQREKRGARHVPIIAITAYAAPEDHENCIAAGMDAYLAKPIDVARLVELVERSVAKPVSPARSAAQPQLADAKRPQTAIGDDRGARSANIGDLSAAANEFANDAAVIDHQGTLKRLGGDSDLLRKIIDLFDEDAPGLLQTIREAVTATDPGRLHRAAHSLKGLAANFGAQDAMRSASRLEEMCKVGQFADAEQAMSELQREIERLDKALTPYRRSPTVRSAAPQA